jgi:hypothetical protein
MRCFLGRRRVADQAADTTGHPAAANILLNLLVIMTPVSSVLR